MAFPARVFCDTSFFYASLDSGDANHEHAATLTTAAATRGSVLSTTWDIVSETATLLRYRAGFSAAWTFLSEVKPLLHIVPYGDGVRTEAEDVFHRYGMDHRLSFCDAISFVVVTTLLDNMPCLAFGEDFRRLGLTVIT